MPTNTYPDPPAHKCSAHLVHKMHHAVETHGLDCGPYEEWDEEWDECRVCGEKFDEVDMEELMRDEAQDWPVEDEDGPDYLSAYKDSIES